MDTTLLFDIYYGAVSLLSEGEHGFASKTSKIQRLDPLCFWVERENFFRLEKYLRQFELERALPKDSQKAPSFSYGDEWP